MVAKSGRRTKYIKNGIIAIIFLLMVNIIIVVVLHHHASDTMVILREFRKISAEKSRTYLTNQLEEQDSRNLPKKDKSKEARLYGRDHYIESRKRVNKMEDNFKRLEEDAKLKQVVNENQVKLDIHPENGPPFVDVSKETFGAIEKSKKAQIPVIQPIIFKDEEIDQLIWRLNYSKLEPFFPKSFWQKNFSSFAHTLGRKKRKTGATLPSVKTMYKKTDTNWRKFHANIRRYSLYNPHDEAIDRLLKDMATQRIISTDDTDGGTELKIIVTFEDGGRAILKPMRFPRDWPINPNIFVFDEMERHIAEIAAFHLDRILGFYRVPPTVGRNINVTEFYTVAPKSVQNTYYKSPAGNTCFFGKCDFFCDSSTPFCGNPDMIEVSLMAYLPSRIHAKRASWYQPYKGAYSKWKKAPWETDERFCDTLKSTYPYNTGKLLLDMIDAHTFDFLNGNQDRHSFAFFKEFGNFSFPILYDNGRGYGLMNFDPLSILAPLRQCCIIRKSTFLKYIKLYSGPQKLSTLMEQSLSNDPVAPVLLKGHLEALDRRLVKILKTVVDCLKTRSLQQVILYDSF